MSDPMLTVVVPTRDRASKLRGLLESLAAAAVPDGFGWEVVVVDNGSTDDTRGTADGFARAWSVPCRVLRHELAAKTVGLNLGVRDARGTWIAFVDDDIRVAPDWPVRIADAIVSDPGLAGLGGRVEPWDEAAITAATRRSSVATTLERDPFPARDIPILGCNMALPKAVVEEVGAFDERFGPGSVVGCGDDVEFLYRVCRAGHRVRYLPEVVVYHDHGRHSDRDAERTRRRYLRGRGGFYGKFVQRDSSVARTAYWEVRAMLGTFARSVLRGRPDGTSLGDLATLTAGALAYRRALRR